MPTRNYYNFCFLFCTILFSGDWPLHQKALKDFTTQTAYYFSANGNDNNDGSLQHPKKSLYTVRNIDLKAGDSILLKSGEVFNDSLIISISATAEKPVVLASYGSGNAIINAGNQSAITVFQSSFINIKNINCKGAGRKNGNIKPGLLISDCKNINVENVETSGFQKSGLQVYNCINTKLNNVYAHDNGAAGIGVEGDYNNKLNTRNVSIINCSAVNNPGDPTNFTNHSGNGIVVGHATNVLIDHCMATNNGWDMPRIGNGPVGIWAYEADSVIIQHCLSYKNKTSKGAADGGGFDLDGGVTNSVVQYNLSYKNYGSGYCIFQYWGASPWYNNVFRFNISIDDGMVTDSRAGVYVWNSSKDSTQFYNSDFYNNTIYNSGQAAISYSELSERKNFRFFNNIFIGKDSLIHGNEGDDTFIANDWWSLKDSFNINGNKNFKNWATVNNKEQLNGVIKGINVLPLFEYVIHNSIDSAFTNANKIVGFNNYKIIGGSPVTQSGIDLQSLFNINIGDKDFNDQPVNKKYIGACTNK